jgi:hypothetical protein
MMTKYEPLTHFLRRQTREEVRLSFGDIEKIIGDKLPSSAAHHRAWWSNNPSNSVMTKAWLAAGFKSEQVDIEGRKLVFRRVAPKRGAPPSGNHESLAEDQAAPRKKHALIGWMKGTLRIAPGTDLTAPADPEWGERALGGEP